MKKSKWKLLLVSLILLAAASATFFALIGEKGKEDNSINMNAAIKFTGSSFMDAVSLARKENKPLFVMVHASWCPSCRKMKKNVLPEKELAEVYNTHFINIMVDYDSEDGELLRIKYDIPGTPTFLYINTGGSIMNKAVGYQTKEQLIDLAQGSTTANKEVCK